MNKEELISACTGEKYTYEEANELVEKAIKQIKQDFLREVLPREVRDSGHPYAESVFNECRQEIINKAKGIGITLE